MEFLGGLQEALSLGLSVEDFKEIWHKEHALKQAKEQANILQLKQNAASSEGDSSAAANGVHQEPSQLQEKQLTDLKTEVFQKMDLLEQKFFKHCTVLQNDMTDMKATLKDMKHHVTSCVEDGVDTVMESLTGKLTETKIAIQEDLNNFKKEQQQQHQQQQLYQQKRMQNQHHHQEQRDQQNLQIALPQREQLSNKNALALKPQQGILWKNRDNCISAIENCLTLGNSKEYQQGHQEQKPPMQQQPPPPLPPPPPQQQQQHQEKKTICDQAYEPKAPDVKEETEAVGTDWSIGTLSGSMDRKLFEAMVKGGSTMSQQISRSSSKLRDFSRSQTPLERPSLKMFPKFGAVLRVQNLGMLASSGGNFQSTHFYSKLKPCKVCVRLWFTERQRLGVNIIVSPCEMDDLHSWPVVFSGTGEILNPGSDCYTTLWEMSPYQCERPKEDIAIGATVRLATKRLPVDNVTMEVLKSKRYINDEAMTIRWIVCCQEGRAAAPV